MPTTHKYPFITGEDLKAAASQVNLSFDIANIQSSLSLAANDLKDVVAKTVWDRMLTHFNSGDYSATGTTLNDKLVNAFLAPLANMALYHHFIWLQLNISNAGITVVKTDNVTSAFKYQTDEAKDKLMQTAWIETNNLIDFLNENKADIEEWTASSQYADLAKLIFANYKEFDQYHSIDKNAAFYIRIRFIIAEIIKEYIQPRITEPYTIADAVKLIKVKRFLAYKAIAEALLRLDPMHLPISIRQSITNNMSSKHDDYQFLKEKLRAAIDNRATNYLHELDVYTSAKVADADVPEGETQYTKFEANTNPDRKFYSAL